MEFLHDPFWQFLILASIGLLTIIVPLLAYLKKQNQRAVTYRVSSNTSILGFKEDVKDRVQVLFDNKPVSDLRLVILELWNSGSLPILPNDHIDPIRFDLGKNAEILDVDVLETTPIDIKEKVKASLKIGMEDFVLEPLLLNSNDSITLKILVAQPLKSEDIRVIARIVGVNQIMKERHLIRLALIRITLYSSYLIFLTVMIYVLLSRYENNLFTKLFLLLLLIVAGLIYILLFIILDAVINSFKHNLTFTSAIKSSLNRLFAFIRYVITSKYE